MQEHVGMVLGSMRGSHGIAVLEVMRKMVLKMGQPLVHGVRRAGMGLQVWRLGKLQVKLLPLCVALPRLLPLLLLQRCRPRRLIRRARHTLSVLGQEASRMRQ